MNWFLCARDLRHEKVKNNFPKEQLPENHDLRVIIILF